MAIEDTEFFKRLQETKVETTWAQDKIADLARSRPLQAEFDEPLVELGSFAPGKQVMESDEAYAVKLGECAAGFGPDERKRIDRSKLHGPALAAFIKEDLEILKAEAHTPNYTLREGVLTERQRTDASGRKFTEFYSKSGPSIWMDSCGNDPIIRYVSGGSKGIATPDNPPPKLFEITNSS